MRLYTGLPGAEFALLARPRATSGTTDSLYLFESRLLGLHGLLMMQQSEEEECSILHNAVGYFWEKSEQLGDTSQWVKLRLACRFHGSAEAEAFQAARLHRFIDRCS
jgi:hypothetical protein